MIYYRKRKKIGWTWQYKPWHKWFAWYPIVIETYDEKEVTKVWWQYVWRTGKYISAYEAGWWEYEYSLSKPFDKIKQSPSS